MAKADERDFFQAGTRAISTVTVLSLSILALIMLYPIWDVIVFACVFAFLFKPLEARLARHIGPFFGAFIPTLLIFFVIVLPVMMVIQLFYSNLPVFSNFVQNNVVVQTLSAFSAYLPAVVIQTGVFNFASEWLGSIFVSVPTLFVKVLLMLFLVYYLLREGERLFEYFYDVLPARQVAFIKAFIGLGKGNIQAVIYGHFLTSLIISLVTILVAYVLGAPHLSTLSILILMFAIAPIIGAWVVLVPLALYYIGLGNLLLGGAYVVFALFLSVLDDFVRPKLVSKNANIHVAVVMVGFVSGAMLFGIVGFLLGPIMLTFLKTALDAYKTAIKIEQKS